MKRASSSLGRSMPLGRLLPAALGVLLAVTSGAGLSGAQEWPAVDAVSVDLAVPAVAVAAEPAAQPVPPAARTILVNGYGTAIARAESARIEFLFDGSFEVEMMPGMATSDVVVEDEPTPPQLVEADLEPIVDAIVAAGAPRDGVEVLTGPVVSGSYGPGGPGAGLIEVLVEQPNLDLLNAIIDAASGSAIGVATLEQVGVEYDVADCAPLIEVARQAAIDNAMAQAEALAQQLGVALGEVVQVSDYSPYTPTTGDDLGCTPPPELGYYSPGGVISAPAFNPLAPAEARVFSQLSITFAFESGQP